MDQKRHLIKYCSRIMRRTYAHLDSELKDFGVSSGCYPYLLELDEEEGINLDRISRKLNVDKALSTRAIQKLSDQGYIEKVADQADSRAYLLYLTELGRAQVPGIREKISSWIDEITEGLSDEDKITVVRLLGKIVENTESKGLK